MHDTGRSGGSGVRTNWSAASVTDMWLAVANQDTTRHWQLLSGWRRSYELTEQHMTQVKNYRANLAAAWPPDRSPAAAAYLARLDELIDHLRGTYEAAVANYTAFNGATMALTTARADLEKVVNEYVANEGRLQEYARERAERPVGGLQRRPDPKPPVPDGRQAELEAKARRIMYALSTELSLARTALKQPALYDDRKIVEVDGQVGDRYAAPPVPPVNPIAFESGANSASSPSEPAQQPIATNATFPAQPGGQGRMPGLILGGADTPPLSPPPSTISPSSPTGGSQPPAALPSPVLGTPAPPIGGAPRVPLGHPVGNFNSGGANVGTPRGGTPSGGVIGSVPGGNVGAPPPSRSVPHVNPVGGLIGPGNNQGHRTYPKQGHPLGIPAVPLGRAEPGNDGAKPTKHWDPDNPWETTKGVTPVIRPAPEQRIDPGPAIGL